MTPPSATFVESQLNVYGAVVELPTIVPLARKLTRATPTLSLALAFTDTVPLTVLPAAGDVMLTVGGCASGGDVVFATLTVSVAEEELPAPS
jgi:hypothetical protein